MLGFKDKYMIDRIYEKVTQETKEITQFMRDRASHIEDEEGIEFKVFGEGEWTDTDPQTSMENAIYDDGYLAGYKAAMEDAKSIIEE